MNTNTYLSGVQKDLSLYQKEKVIIVSIRKNEDYSFYYELNELKSLCEACGYVVEETVSQKLDNINAKTYLGIGKIQEIKEIALSLDIEKIVFNDELTPAQIKNLQDILTDMVIIDRTMLILEIFDKRATSKIGHLQVELARLKYMLPRLVGSRTYLSRIGSGSSVRSRGEGETKLELDRRHINNKINQVKKELEYYKNQRQTTRKLRQNNEIKTVCLVGYTNAGKSSTLNALLSLYNHNNSFNTNHEKEVYVEDMLFATLETQTRKIKLPNNHEVLLTDTIGFISKLPHHLIESFKSTLEEIHDASLIVNIVDASSPYKELQASTTLEVLESLGVKDIPVITALNKCDLVMNDYFIQNYPDAIKISAKFKDGLRELVNKIDETLFNKNYLCTFLIPYTDGKVLNILKKQAEIFDLSFENEGTYVKAKVSEKLYNQYQQYLINKGK